uniref:C2H2-type domain-containing protein n=1 Tax=Salmo trutta TaxID=8032 RepID=A0A674C7N7_SALTR
MTKLQLLNAYLTERLTVVVREILDVVGDTVAEYREETARTKRENERQAIPKTEHNSDPEAKGFGNTSSLAPSPFSSNAHCATTTGAANAEVPVLRTERKRSSPIDPIQGRIKMEPKECDVTLNLTNHEPQSSSGYTGLPITLLPHNHELSGDAGFKDLPDMDISELHNTPVHDQQTYETEPGSKDQVLPYNESNNFTPTDHQEGRPHRCTRCGESFSQAASLHLHLQYKKPYACDWCCKSFAQSADLRRHHRIHTGERPHRCSWCSKSFTQRGNLRRHLRLEYIIILGPELQVAPIDFVSHSHSDIINIA